MMQSTLNVKSVAYDRTVYSETPMDHLSLLNPILGNTGCLRSANDVNILVKYMENCSQMISQCIVINILKNTRAPSTLERFVDSKGWAILSNWVKFAREKNDVHYLIELIQVLIKFPQTIQSLKEGSIGKCVKQLSKSDNLELQKCSKSVLIKWKKFLKEQQMPTKFVKSLKNTHRDSIQSSLLDLSLQKSDLNTTLHSSSSPFQCQYDNSGKLDAPRNFRAIKLSASDLSSKRIKNNSNSDNILKLLPPHKVNTCCLQPNSVDNLIPNSESVIQNPSFHKDESLIMKHDQVNCALTGACTYVNSPILTRIQCSPVESKKFSEAISESANRRSISKKSSTPVSLKNTTERLRIDSMLEGDRTGVIDTNFVMPIGNILSNSVESDVHVLPKSKIRKHVTWAPEEFLTDIRFIEVEDADFGSMQVHGTFHDAIMQEKRSERCALAHLFTNDRMLALVQWTNPKVIDFLEPLVEPGSKSAEILNQAIRERSVLALLFLTKDSAPDDPGEPEIEDVQGFKEPKIIPLYEPGKEPLPEMLSISPVKAQIPLQNMYPHPKLPKQVFNSIHQPLFNIPMLPFPPQYPLCTPNVIPSLNPTSCCTTDSPSIPIQSNPPSSHPRTSPQRGTTSFPVNSIPNHVSGTRQYTNVYKRKAFRPSFRGRKFGKNLTPCQHFSKGFCKKGELCDFRH